METENKRVLGRVLAVEEANAVSGAKQTSPSVDTFIDVNGNADTNTTQDTGPKADPTNPFVDAIDDTTNPLLDTTSPITD